MAQVLVNPKPKSAPDRPSGLTLVDSIFTGTIGEDERNKYLYVERDKIDPNPFQARRTFKEKELKELGESMLLRGQAQPLLVRPHPQIKGRYQLIAGERRLRASEPRAGFNGLPMLQVIIRKTTDEEMPVLSFAENAQREDYTPAEEVWQIQLWEKHGLTSTQIESLAGKGRGWVGKRKQAAKIPESLKWILDHNGYLEHALEIDRVKDVRIRYQAAQFLKTRIEKDGCSIGELKAFINERMPKDAPTKEAPAPANNGITTSRTENPHAEAYNAHIAATTTPSMDWGNEPIVTPQGTPQRHEMPRMDADSLQRGIRHAHDFIARLTCEYSRLSNVGTFATDARIEMRQQLREIARLANEAAEGIQ